MPLYGLFVHPPGAALAQQLFRGEFAGQSR